MAKSPFGVAKAEESLGLLLWQTTTIWQRLIKKALEQYEISHPQFVIMATLFWFEMHNHDTNQIQIVSWTKLDKMTVSKALKNLVALGCVSRVEHTNDSRAKSVKLTNAGKVLVRKLVPVVESIDAKFFAKLAKSEQRNLLQTLAKLVAESNAMLE